VGGEAVNLIPGARPHDVYKMVAEAVLAKLEDNAVEDDLAALWLRSGLIDRTLCKRPTMTFGYGSKAYGFSQQLREELRGRANWKTELRVMFDATDDETGKVREGGQLNYATDYLARVIYSVLRELVQKAVEGMEWMRLSARTIAKEQRAVEWTVPLTGFRVAQHYKVMSKTQIRTALCGGISRAVVRTETDVIAVTKQANAVAPNIVHSLDAAALQLTVCAALDAGVTHFQMIHDSYGTHAADMGTLSATLREQFIRLYKSGVVENLAAQFAAQSPEDAELPVLPASGSLDLDGIQQSLYFFS
jgi:DNA-directed RNA polymerase, mitochondrial